MSSYQGRLPNTDEYQERLDNAEHVQAGSVGMKRVLSVDENGNVVGGGADTAVVTSVSDSDSNQTLLAANTSRRGFIIFNDSTAILYIKYGTTATASSFTVRLTPYGTHESKGDGVYNGKIDGIWASNASGSARITEIT